MVSGRVYKTTVTMDVYVSNTDTIYVCKLTDASNSQLQRFTARNAYANSSLTQQILYYETAAASGSVTRKVRMVRASGTGTINVQAGVGGEAQIIVEDIGPA